MTIDTVPEVVLPAAPTADLTGPQEIALAALLGGASIVEAARQADVSRQTVSRWRRADSDFRIALAKGWQELRMLTYNRIAGLANEALSTLRDVMLDAVDSRSRVRAAEIILDLIGGQLRPTQDEVRDYYA